MSTITAEAVWKKISEEPEYLEQPEPIREATRPFMEALPTILTDLLSTPVTLSILMQAKVKFLRYCLDNGYVKAIVDVTPVEELEFFDRDELPAMVESILSDAINMAKELAGDVSEQLKNYDLTEEEVMLGPTIGLNETARELYVEKKLTIGELLLIQPLLIVKNS